MAKRRRLEAPSSADLDKLEEEFRRETPISDPLRAAPIAQVARETAQAIEVADPKERAERARDEADAVKYREIADKELILHDIPINEIDKDSMVRDRSVMDSVALQELHDSILKNGMRLPIEVYELPESSSRAGQGARYGLLSGYRRLSVLRDLHAKMGEGHFETARAIVRTPAADADRFAAMVEENEIRQQLSHYERGRIAAIAADQGVFANTEAAVQAMFPTASKAKRSKIRSFAMIFEDLGDILDFPENLREKDGLRIAGALRDGAEQHLRKALETGRGRDAAAEWATLSDALDALEVPSERSARGGRPKAKKLNAPGWNGNTLLLSSGIKIKKGSDAKGYSIHLSGDGLSPDILEGVIERISYLLEKPD
ncbi:ParB N-terminal domain-containing protein [Octadecabacter sp. CECT 8868]|uniref:ParB/RepB/Spo0J family partition protein n=1 Tax=Octadecabacter algicola TaxID=2909342 RepID=UPI001F209563|nr:ParB N-terminal domain-containing protein [Octadecabacter algicola]MCF2906705.1 ParB N-terminal domain-containing protein [Octadecabacter algicola]